jgi:DnaJ family protein C protein 11
LAPNSENSSESLSSIIIDVTIPLQYLVEDSQLHLHDGSKAHLLGFYDPCIGEDKQLYIRYLFHDKLHEVTIDDSDVLGLPLACKLHKWLY